MLSIVNELEVAIKERLENLNLADTVVLDFNERLDGDSVLIFGVRSLRSLEPVMDGKLYRATLEGHVTGVWKVKDGDVTSAITSRNDALERLVEEFLYTKVGGAYVRVTKWEKDIRQDVMDDRRFYVLFDVTLEIKVNVR